MNFHDTLDNEGNNCNNKNLVSDSDKRLLTVKMEQLTFKR